MLIPPSLLATAVCHALRKVRQQMGNAKVKIGMRLDQLPPGAKIEMQYALLRRAFGLGNCMMSADYDAINDFAQEHISIFLYAEGSREPPKFEKKLADGRLIDEFETERPVRVPGRKV
jgi:hypothetical protein